MDCFVALLLAMTGGATARLTAISSYVAGNPRGFAVARPHPGLRPLRALTRGY